MFLCSAPFCIWSRTIFLKPALFLHPRLDCLLSYIILMIYQGINWVSLSIWSGWAPTPDSPPTEHQLSQRWLRIHLTLRLGSWRSCSISIRRWICLEPIETGMDTTELPALCDVLRFPQFTRMIEQPVQVEWTEHKGLFESVAQKLVEAPDNGRIFVVNRRYTRYDSTIQARDTCRAWPSLLLLARRAPDRIQRWWAVWSCVQLF